MVNASEHPVKAVAVGPMLVRLYFAAAMGVRHCTHRSIEIKAGLVLGTVNAG